MRKFTRKEKFMIVRSEVEHIYLRNPMHQYGALTFCEVTERKDPIALF